MGNFEIIKRNGETIPLFSREPHCAVTSATQNSSLMGDDNVQLQIVSSEMLTFAKGDKIVIGGEEYFIRTKVNREMVSENHFTYEATFYGVMYDLMKSLFRNTGADGKSTASIFDLTYSIREFVKVIIYNVERDYPGVWKFDEDNCPDTEPRTISFSQNNCLQVLQTLCSEDNFDLEFLITQEDGVRTIHIGKFGSKVTPPAGGDYFEYGQGRGLYSLKEQKVDDKTIITRLWVEGGTNNIRSDYRDYSERLQLPYPKRLNKNAHTLSDGTVIAAGSETIGIDDDSKRYLEDAELAAEIGSDEDAKTYDDIYPKRTGVVTALVDGDINAFIDDTMDFDLCEKDSSGTKWLIDSVSAKITFITGKLAGQEFELSESKGYDHSTKKFTLLPFTDSRGLKVPTEDSEAFRINVGDKYKITDINLPTAYEDNAEEDLWYAGMDDFKPLTQAQAQYQLTFDRKYFLDSISDDSDTSVFHVGDYVPVKDERFGIEKNIRIQKVVRNLLLEHDYTLTLSDTTAISIQAQTTLDVIQHDIIINNNRLRDLNKARRGWRTTEELRTLVFDTDGYFDNENIRPNSIDTNMLTVGSKSQQFVLIDTVLQANVNGNGNRFNASAGTLAHLTIDEDSIRKWDMSFSEFTLASAKGYYLYAKCPKDGGSGVWYMTQEQLSFEPTTDADNYYFLVGILSSLYDDDNFRDFTTTYGYTRINGNTITTGKIVTSDGECYLDLDGNQFRIGDSESSVDWNVTKKNQITLKNVSVMSGSGDTSNLGVFRGTYNADYIYYKGDEVLYTTDGATMTYRYINADSSKGNLPTNSVYWAIVAKGSDGEDGNNPYFTYNDSIEKPSKPTGNGTSDGWHNTSTDEVRWMSVKTAKTINDGTWGDPIKVRGADGTSITIKGSVTSVSQLPTTGNTVGDAYLLNGNLYIWDDTTWNNVGQIKGDNGTSSYLHIKYSDDGGKTFTDGNGETPDRYIGILVNNDSTDSDTPSDYTWNDTIGAQGIPGEDGEDGKTTYLHIKYSDDGGLSFTANNGETTGRYIGVYTDFEEADSDNTEDYTWSRVEGTAGLSGADAEASDYYEYRYAKNGSTTEAPELDATAAEPAGWAKTMPTTSDLEYVWMTMAKKSLLVDKTVLHIPVTEPSEEDDTSMDDVVGSYDGRLSNGASVVEDYGKYVVDVSGSGECTIPYDLPFGESFTLCLKMKTDQTELKWMLNGYNGREYVEKTIEMTANIWCDMAFRFNDKSVTVFKDGVVVGSGALNEEIVGFALYDDNMFGSSVYFDEIRVFKGALAVSDIEKVKLGTVDDLVQKWSTPVRVTPYDGKDGKSPALVYRGVYDETKTYYGMDTRVDAVKYNGVYYVARIDAGSFYGIAPTDTDKWNTFGAQFESIATNLLLAEGANIGDWFISNGKIVSTLEDGNIIILDAKNAEISVESSKAGGSYSMDETLGSKLILNAISGVLRIDAKKAPSYSTGTAYMSPTGIFANLAGTNGMPASSGYTHRGAIVGLGYANVNKSTWAVNAMQTIVAGMYGVASNKGTAPAFGGYFYNLFAGGLVLGRKCITGTDGTTYYLEESDTLIIGYTSATATVYLPSNPTEGQVVFVKQWWTGKMRFKPLTGHHIYDDSSENEYYDFSMGKGGMFTFTIGYITVNGTTTKKEAWLVSRWEF